MNTFFIFCFFLFFGLVMGVWLGLLLFAPKWMPKRPTIVGWYLLEMIPPKSDIEVTYSYHVVVWAYYNSENVFKMVCAKNNKVIEETDCVYRHMSIPEPK